MKKLSLLSLAAVAALATEPVTIQKITIEADGSKSDAKNLSADEMVKFSRQSDLAEMLSQTLPEITHVRNSAVGNDIILRGFRKDNLNITIDDAKVCGACPNRMDPPSMHVSSAQIKSVEVQEGPFDVTQFGSLGGKINVVTKDPEKGLHGEVSATLGSFDYRKLSTTVEGGNDDVQAVVGFSRETSGQYKDGEGRTLTEQTAYLLGNPLNPQAYDAAYMDAKAYERNNYWAKIVSRFGGNQKLTLSYFGDRADDVLYPRYKMDAQVDDTDMFKAKYELFNLSDYSEELKVEAYHSKVTHVMGTDFRNWDTPMVFINAGTTYTTIMETPTVAPVDATIQGASIENTLHINDVKVSVGLDTSIRNWNGTKFMDVLSMNRTPPGMTMFPAATVSSLLPDVDTKNIALYAKAIKHIGNYEFSGGVRYDDTTINADQSLMANVKDRNYNNISAHLLAKYNYTPSTNVFFGIGQSVRVPDAKELYWPISATSTTSVTTVLPHDSLNETINREIDLGAEHTAGNFHIKGTAFYSDLKDFIYQYKHSTVTTTMGIATLTPWTNIDAKIYGFDLQTDYLLNNEWRVEAGTAYQRGIKKDVAELDALAALPQTDKDLAEIPPLKARAALVFDNAVDYAMAEWIGARSQIIDANNGEKPISGYGLINLKYGHDFQNGFALMTGVNNFFNRTYAINNSYIGNELISGSVPLVLNEPGRSFYATVSYKF